MAPTLKMLLRASLAVALTTSAACAQAPTVRFLTSSYIPVRAPNIATPIGGISGLTYLPATDTWIAVADAKRPEHGPAFIELRITLGPAVGAEFPPRPSLHIEPLRAFDLPAQGNRPVDAEAIASTPDNSRWFIGFESPPAIAIWTRAHDSWAPLPIPASFIEKIRPNRAFECVAYRHLKGDDELWIATEAAVNPDPIATRSEGQRCRVLVFDPQSLTQRREFTYITEPLPPGEVTPACFTALAEFTALPDGRILAVEKSADAAGKQAAALFYITGESRPIASAPDAPPVLIKHPMKTFAALGIDCEHQMEALALGPALPGNSRERLLIVIADDNFTGAQHTDPATQPKGSQIIALAIKP